MSNILHLLHVDDDPALAELVAEFIKRIDDGIEVDSAASASDGLDRLEENHYDCVVSDYEMPGQNGIEFLNTIREDDADLPFILFTGKGSEEIASQAISAGVTDYLQKGSGNSQYEVLANRIRNAVESARARLAVDRTETWAKTLLEHSSDYLFVVDETGTISYVSPSVERVLGYHPDDLTGTNAFDFVHPDDVEEATSSFGSTVEKPHEDITVEFRAKHADGSDRWLEVRGRNLLADEIIGGVLVNARDITERKTREEALRQSENRFRSIAESATDAIVTIDADSVVQYANPAVGPVFGYEPDELEGQSLTMLLPERYRDRHRTALERYLDTGEESLDWSGIDFPGLHKDGHEIDLRISFSEMRWNGRHRFTGIIRRVGSQ